MIRRGEVRWFRFTSPDKRRPVLVVGRDDVLPSLAQIPVIPAVHPRSRADCGGRSPSAAPRSSPSRGRGDAPLSWAGRRPAPQAATRVMLGGRR